MTTSEWVNCTESGELAVAFNSGLLLADLLPEVYGMVAGYCESDRQTELLRLTVAAPAGCAGYVPQIASGTRKVRIDAMQMMERHGLRFVPSPSELIP